MIFYLEFGTGQSHKHSDGTILDRDTICIIHAPNERQAEWFATRKFGEEWQMIFSERITDKKFLEQYKNGIVQLNNLRQI